MNLRVIDFYSGVGGWSVGFHLAGFEIVSSYEWWEPAVKTHEHNLGTQVMQVDIRNIDPKKLPEDIDVVVGSPPCTQFSYSNRGGSGDINDGLLDIKKFLEIVDYLKPKFWAIENVPRVAKILKAELSEGGVLVNYLHLFSKAQIEIIDMAEYGVPQKRKRCVVGNFDFKLLKSYTSTVLKPTLGEVLSKLENGLDPNYNSLEKHVITETQTEEPLSWEEERFNRDMKTSHPVYNRMPFPEPMDVASRTITATCTRVSRESLIIPTTQKNQFRRLSVRERACLQGFPVNFQFMGKSHSQKLKMIGNAIPPLFTYLIANAMSHKTATSLVPPHQLDVGFLKNNGKHFLTQPDKSGRSYPANRRFRFSIKTLHFKSGTRFELTNSNDGNNWEIQFYYGDSKRILSKKFELDIIANATHNFDTLLTSEVDKLIAQAKSDLVLNELDTLQRVWSHQGEGTHPFKTLDKISNFAKQVSNGDFLDKVSSELIEQFVCAMLDQNPLKAFPGRNKVFKFSAEILLGAIIAAVVNKKLNGVEQKT